MIKKIRYDIKLALILLVSVHIPHEVFGQFYNKEVVAKINIEAGSEFYIFKATTENKTNVGYSLRYEYTLYVTEENGEVSKSSQENRFFIEAYHKKILNKLTLNYNFEKKCIILFLIYDENDKIVGKDRLELEQGGKTKIKSKNKFAQANTNLNKGTTQNKYIPKGFINKKLITRSGKDFFRYFYSDFYNLDVVTDKNISIEEKFGRGRNTRIVVKVEDKIVLQFFTQPRKDFLVSAAKTALSRVLAQIQLLNKQQQIQY